MHSRAHAQQEQSIPIRSQSGTRPGSLQIQVCRSSAGLGKAGFCAQMSIYRLAQLPLNPCAGYDLTVIYILTAHNRPRASNISPDYGFGFRIHRALQNPQRLAILLPCKSSHKACAERSMMQHDSSIVLYSFSGNTTVIGFGALSHKKSPLPPKSTWGTKNQWEFATNGIDSKLTEI